jgi:hypothetical protein
MRHFTPCLGVLAVLVAVTHATAAHAQGPGRLPPPPPPPLDPYTGAPLPPQPPPPAPAPAPAPAFTPAPPYTPAPAYAPAPAPTDAPASDDRTLSGHTFIFPILQQGAFNTTHFGVREGFVFVSVPQVPLGSATYNINASGLIQNFDLGVKILPWLGGYGTLTGQLTTGVDVDSLVILGGAFSFSGEGGGVVRVLRLEETGTQVVVRVFAGGGSGRNVGVLPLVQNIINGNATLNDVLTGAVGKYVLTPTSNFTFGASVHGAQAVGPFVGFQAALEGRSTRDTQSPFDPNSNAYVDQSTTTNTFRGSLSADVDGNPAGFPLGAMLEYQAEVDSASGATTTSHFIAGGVYYTGRRNLLLGLGAATQLAIQPILGVDANGNSVASGTPSQYYGQFVLRYVW